MSDFWLLSFPPMLVASLAAVATALIGNFLVLARESLLADAMSHVVLPGIVVAFLVTGGLSSPAMLAGAVAAAVLAAALIALVRRAGVEGGAATGVVFSVMFAAGVVLLELSDARAVHLDVEHALLGNLESLVWLSGFTAEALLDPQALADLPPQVFRLSALLVAVALFLFLLRRRLVVSCFDPVFAAATGLRPSLVLFALTLVAAVAAVFAFEAVGAILVVATFVCPAAAARLMTDRLGLQIAWSALFALIAANGGYLAAGYGPGLLGYDASLSSAGMIAVFCGLILAAAARIGPCRRGNRRVGSGR